MRTKQSNLYKQHIVLYISQVSNFNSFYINILFMIMKLFNNKFLYLIFSIFISIPIIAQEESINQIIEYGLKRAENQSLILAQELKNREHVLPRTY